MSIAALSTAERDVSVVVQIVRQLSEGRNNATGSCTLTAGTTTTTVTALNCGVGSVVMLSPTTANAATAIATTYVSATANGSFTLTHANNAQSDRRFGFVCLG